MPSHQLVEKDKSDEVKWFLEWDATAFTLKDPDGQPVFTVDPVRAREVIDPVDLFEWCVITFKAPRGSITFRGEGDALRDLRAFLEEGIRTDDAYREKLRANALWMIRAGPVMFVVGVILFALLIVFTRSIPNPPPGAPVTAAGPLVYVAGTFLIAAILGGPVAFLHGLNQWFRLRSIERSMARGDVTRT